MSARYAAAFGIAAALAAVALWLAGPEAHYTLLGLGLLGLGALFLFVIVPHFLYSYGPYLLGLIVIVGVAQAIIDL